MMKQRGWSLACVALCVVALGCGGDDDSGAAAGSGSSAGSGGSAGSTTAGSGGSTAGSGGSGGSSATMTVVCGGTTCQTGGFMLPGIMIPGLPTPCCLPDNTCGQQTTGTCMPKPPPPVTDPTCPGISVAGMTTPGCCINDQCGVDASIFGMGCLENSAAAAQIGALPGIGGLIMIPAARACGIVDDGGADQDGGI